MAEPLKLRFDDLRAALSAVLSNAEARLGHEISLDRDFYWSLPVAEAFDMSKVPSSPTVGQLSDDVETVTQRDWSTQLASHDLVHLLGVLRFVEERLHH